MAAYTTIDDPGAYFNTVLYAGNSSTQSITGVGFQPDWTWIKNRSDSRKHNLYDAVRGVTKRLVSNDNGEEDTASNGLTSFDSDGFTSGSEQDTNHSGNNFVSWNWKTQGGAGSSNEDGSINTTSTSVSQTAGVSISKFTATGSAATVGHGLGVAPKMVIVKDLDAADNWYTYHNSIGNTKAIYLDLTNAESGASTNFWNDTSPTSSVFSIASAFNTNSQIAYCFADVQGFSKLSSYTGNGNADGTFVYTGFKPAMVLQKMSSSAGYSWHIFDNKRDTYNPIDKRLFPDATDGDSTSTNVDFLSNGFKFRSTATGYNGSGNTFIYMAFAEAPFVNSNGVPCNAR